MNVSKKKQPTGAPTPVANGAAAQAKGSEAPPPQPAATPAAAPADLTRDGGVMETLTEGERCGLLTVEPLSTDWRVQKALRTIDAQAARIAELEAAWLAAKRETAQWRSSAERTESKLAAASALLEECGRSVMSTALSKRIYAHLAGQPAAAPTAAERAVNGDDDAR